MGFYRAKKCLTLFLAVLPVLCRGLSRPGCFGIDGQFYNPGDPVPSTNPCDFCTCKDYGEIECAIMDCARPPCPNPIHIEGQCCPVCGGSGCDKDGVIYNTGDPVPSTNPCDFCTCKDYGEIECAIMDCARPPCPNPIHIEGQCCPVCGGSGCDKDGVIYNTGDPVPSTNPCDFCTCKDYGEIECAIMDCARPPCPNPIHIEGQCCPVCGGSGCDKDGVIYNTGDPVPSTNPCDFCTCKDYGEIECAIMDCARPPCPNPIHIEGQCCPVCGGGGCDKDGVIYNTGDAMPSDTPCEASCVCGEEGQRVCAMMSCLQCANPRFVDGKCCPQCGCEQNGEFYNIGESMPSDTPCGVDCTCGENGQKQCKMVPCARPNCENPIVPKGQCCSVCICIFQGKIFEIGQIVNDDPCHPCTCQKNGQVTCESIQCPKLTCRYHLVPKGECCPVCQCRQGNKHYLSGEIVDNVTCKPLVCQSNGSIKTEPVECPDLHLQCVDSVIPKGKCCPQCKNGRTCAHEKLIIPYGEDKLVGSQICRCGGDPWFPNAFCAEKKVSERLLKDFGKYLADYNP